MKILALLFLVGFAASASIYDALEDEADAFYNDFMLGLEDAGSLREALDLPFDHPVLREAEDETKTELGKRLRKTLDEILEKMKDSLEQGKMYREDLQKKLDEIKAKFKELGVDMGEKAKELMEKVRERVKNFLRDLMDKLKGKERRSLEADFNFKELFNKLRDQLLKKIDKEQLKAKVEEIFGKGSETADSILRLINKFGDKYKQKLLDLVDRFLGKLEESSQRSMQDVWEKIKDYFKNLQIDLKEKYMKFGEWVKNAFDKGLAKGKDRMENIKNIAREFVDHAKGVSKEVAVEALEFLKPYKEDLGSLWDQVKETVKDIVNKRD